MNAFTARIAPISPFKRSQQARVLRSITHQPPQYNAIPVVARTDGAVAALAIRNSQFEALQRARRAGA